MTCFLHTLRAHGLPGRDELQALVGTRGVAVTPLLQLGFGHMHAIDVEADAPAAVLRALTEERLVANATGPHTIRFLPPLTISHEQIDDAAARMRRVLQDA